MFFCYNFCYRYFQSLANNLSFIRYKEVYSAAAEIIGLILNYMTERENVCVAVSSCQTISHLSPELFRFHLMYCCGIRWLSLDTVVSSKLTIVFVFLRGSKMKGPY